MDCGRKQRVDFIAGKTQLVSFDQSNNTGAIDVKMDGFILEEKSYFKMLGLCCVSLLNWIGTLTLSVLLKPPKRAGALIRSMKFLFHEVALHLYKSTIWPYCCHVWTGAPSWYLDLLDELQKHM